VNHEVSKHKLLIVDDVPVNIRILEKILEPYYRVSSATNGSDALEIAGSDNSPDLILLDIMMPVFNGYEVCKALRQNPGTKNIPVILVTANTDDETLREAFKSGGTDYVRKPVKRIELLARIEAALKQQSLTRRLLEEEKLRGVLEMAGAVCHELNQPLQAVSGYADLLMMDRSEGDFTCEALKNIKGEISKMGRITEKLMRITRYETREYLANRKIIDIDRASF
jgi:CheY-like chemotaxis protein